MPQRSLVSSAAWPFLRHCLHIVCAVAVIGCMRAMAAGDALELQWRSSVRHYSYDEGLPQASVNAILRTHDGFLWLGTFGGLVRFDGSEFRVYRAVGDTTANVVADGPSSERILALHEDARHRLWIGTQEAGVNLLENGRFRRLPVCGAACQVNDIVAVDDRDIWIVAVDGLFRVDADSLKITSYAYALDSYSAVAVAGKRLFAGGLGGFARLSAEGIAPIPLPDGHRIVRGLAADDASVWVNVENGSLYRYDVDADRWTFVRGGLPPETHLASDQRGGVYVSDESSGLRQLSRDGSERTLDVPQPLHARRVYAEADGTLWIGATGKGLWRERPARVSLLRSTTARNAPGRVVVDDGAGGLWFVLGCSMLWHRDAAGSMTRWPTQDALKDDCIFSLALDAPSERLWLGTANGAIGRLADGRLQLVASWPHAGRTTLWRTGDGTLWVANARVVGRLRVDGDGAVAGIADVHELAGMLVNRVVDARAGGVWVVGDSGAFRVVGDAVVERWTSAQGIRGRYFRALHEDADGVLWLGTYGSGLVRIERGVVSQYTSANGLFDDTVSCILPDREGRLWMAGNRGISVLLDRRIGDDGPHLLTLTASDGLDPPEFNGGTAPPCWIDGAGRFWFAMVVGFASIDPAAMEETLTTRIPAVYIDHASVSARAIDLAAPDDLSANASNLEIRFGAIDTIDPDKLRFRYRIDGDAGAWIDAGVNRSVLLPVVPWGRLTFEVQARELGSGWSPPATLRLNRPIPWYRHEWIWLGVSLASLLALLWLTRERHEPDVDDELLARLRKSRSGDGA